MSSQATPQLLEQRRASAQRNLPADIELMRSMYVKAIKARNPGYDPTPAELEEISRGIRKMIRESIGRG